MRRALVAAMLVLIIGGCVVLGQSVFPSELSGLPMIRETPDWAGGISFLQVNQATGEVSFCVRAGICGYGYVMVVPCENKSVVDVYKIYCGGYVGSGRHTVYVNLKNAYAAVVAVVSSPLFGARYSIWPWWCGSRRYPGELSVLCPKSLAGAARILLCRPVCQPDPCAPCYWCNPCCP